MKKVTFVYNLEYNRYHINTDKSFWSTGERFDTPLDLVKDMLREFSDSFINDTLNKQIINRGSHNISLHCRDGKCKIGASFLFSNVNEEKREIYEEVIYVNQLDLHHMVKFYHECLQAQIEEIVLSRDDNNLYLSDSKTTVTMPYTYSEYTSKYHFHEPEDFDENGLHCTYDQDKKDEEDQCECDKE